VTQIAVAFKPTGADAVRCIEKECRYYLIAFMVYHRLRHTLLKWQKF